MQIGPKYKICKRLGSGVFEKCQTQKFLLSEERRGRARNRGRRPRSPSDYGRQLLEKQKVRFMYGISERELSRYVKTSVEKRNVDPSETLVIRLESRLDNAVYRAGLASTRRAARQMVSHGHITVNGARVKVPSYTLKEGETVSIRELSRDRKLFENLDERLKEYRGVSWIQFDPKKMEGAVKTLPSEISELGFDVGAVLEYYSR